MKGKKKRETPYPLERTPGMLGNEEYVLTPLTYASVDERMGNYNNYWTWNRNQMPGIIQLVKPPQIIVLDLQEPLTYRNQLMVGSYYIK